MDRSSYRDLQRRAKELGLRAIGTADNLRRSIEAEEARRRSQRSKDVFLLGLPQELVMRELVNYLDGRSLLSLAVASQDLRNQFSSNIFWKEYVLRLSYRERQQLLIAWSRTAVLLSPLLELIDSMMDIFDLTTLEHVYFYLLQREKKIATDRLLSIVREKKGTATVKSGYFKITAKQLNKFHEELKQQIKQQENGAFIPARLSSGMSLKVWNYRYGSLILFYEAFLDMLPRNKLLELLCSNYIDTKDTPCLNLIKIVLSLSTYSEIDNEVYQALATPEKASFIVTYGTSQWKDRLGPDEAISPIIAMPTQNIELLIAYVRHLLTKFIPDQIQFIPAQLHTSTMISKLLSVYLGDLPFFYTPAEAVVLLETFTEKDRESIHEAIESAVNRSFNNAWLAEFCSLTSKNV